MGHYDLLPGSETVIDAMKEAGVNEEQQRVTLEALAYLLDEHAEYHRSEYSKHGEKSDIGAADSLREFAEWFRSDARYVIGHES